MTATGQRADRVRPARRGPWTDVARGVWREQSRDNLSIVAAGVAYYALFSIFPALAALVAVYGLVVEPEQARQQIESVAAMAPEGAQSIIEDQVAQVAQGGGGLGWGAFFGVLVALWGASRATKSLMTSLDVVYDTPEKRGFVGFTATALVFTLGAVILFILALGLVAVMPALLGFVGLGDTARTLASLARWPVLALVAVAGFAALYRWGPCHRPVDWRRTLPGAILATALWLVASIAFSVYVSNFGSYNETYGSLGAVIILLTWFYISAYLILLGGELNSELERRRGELPPRKPQNQRA